MKIFYLIFSFMVQYNIQKGSSITASLSLAISAASSSSKSSSWNNISLRFKQLCPRHTVGRTGDDFVHYFFHNVSGRNNQVTILSITFSIILTSMFRRDVRNFFHFKFVHPFFILTLYIRINYWNTGTNSYFNNWYECN